MTTTPPPPRRPMRAPWKVALLGFAITLAVGTAVGVIGAMASGSLDRDPHAAGVAYGRAFAPFVIIVTIAAYAIQRARIKR